MHCENERIPLHNNCGKYIVEYESSPTTLASVLGIYGKRDSSNTEEILQKLTKLLEGRGGESNNLFIATQARCLINCLEAETTEQLPVDILKEIIKRKVIGIKDIKTLVPILGKSGFPDLVFECLQNLKDIPESTVVYCLFFFLSCESTTLKETVEKLDLHKRLQEEVMHSSVDKYKAVFINLVLTLPYNDSLLVESLQQIPFEEVLILIKYLQELLHTTVGAIKTKTKSTHPTFLQIIDWLSVLLNSHFTQAILSQDARSVLIKLHETLQEKVEFFDEINQLESLLTQLKDRFYNEQASNKTIGSYCIEVLHF